MIAEVLLVLAGHSSSLFPVGNALNPAFSSLLHPGEQQCLEYLGMIAFRYRKIKGSCDNLSRSHSRYICALCSTLVRILKEEYEALVIDTEAKILKRDTTLVSSGAFVPLSSVRAVFSEWDAPLAALAALTDELQSGKQWHPGPLIDMLLERSKTGIHRVADIISRLSVAVQRVWRTQLTAFLVHGSLSSTDPIASSVEYTVLDKSMPSCISLPTCESISYVGRAIGTLKTAKWQKQPPIELASQHTKMLEGVLPESQHAFDLVISQIRMNVSEWLWLNVLTRKDIEDAVDSLGNYFLLRNGEFSLSLIREVERLKMSRLTTRSGAISMIREQDLSLALLRASLGTSAQHDPSLSRLRFFLPEGPVRPFLPSLIDNSSQLMYPINSKLPFDPSIFSSHLLGTPMSLCYTISWPLDLFLERTDLAAYSTLFNYLSALRKTHTRIHNCWTSLSNAQRARRQWTGLSEGGTAEDLEFRAQLLRQGWGIIREMGWFLDTLLSYVMMDVVDAEFRKLKRTLSKDRSGKDGLAPGGKNLAVFGSGSQTTEASYLDFTTLRLIHTGYLDRLLTGCLLTNEQLMSTLLPILNVCERFVGQVERWGGDILPALLFEGSLKGDNVGVGAMVKERWGVVSEIDAALQQLLESFYEHLTASTSQPLSSAMDSSKSMFINASVVNQTLYNASRYKAVEGNGENRRHVERLLLRLDFNGRLSKPKHRIKDFKENTPENILAQGGLG